MAARSSSSKFYAKGGMSVPICPPVGEPNDIANNLSSVILNQNAANGETALQNELLTQEFYFPDDYARNGKIPDLTGFQFLMAASDSKLKYRIYRYDNSFAPRFINSIDISSASVSGSVITYTTLIDHELEPGDWITVEGFDIAGYNKSNTVITVPSSKTFTLEGTATGTPSTSAKISRPPRGSLLLTQTTRFIKSKSFSNSKIISYKIKVTKPDKKRRSFIEERIITVEGKINIPKKSRLLRLYPIENFSAKEASLFEDSFNAEIKKVIHKKEKIKKKKDGKTVNSTKDITVIYTEPTQYFETILNRPVQSKDWFERFLPYVGKFVNFAVDNDEIHEIWVPSTKKQPITQVIYSNVSLDSGEAHYQYELPVDSRYDSEVGWVGIGEGEIAINSNNYDWQTIQFEPIKINPNWVNQKFKIVLEALDNDSINIKYNVPSRMPKQAQGYKNSLLQYNYDSWSVAMRILAASADEGIDFLSNKYRSTVSKHAAEEVSGNDDNFWSSKPNPSKYGVERLYFDVSDTNDNPVVIDSVYLDPITPGINFNVYYSNDPKGPGTDTNSWDTLLWHHVPKVFKAYKRQNYILPDPISAKYVKIEFSSLQAEYYNSGSNAKPIYYQKYPSWVVNYFLSIYDLQYDKTEDPFIASQTNLNYDLLSLAFNYYRGDIINNGRQPIVIEQDNNQNNIVTNLLRSAKTELENYDLTSLNNINASFDQFQRHPGYNVKANTVIDRKTALKSIDEYFNYSVERIFAARANTDQVSHLDRNHLLLEKNVPVMYFYPICRHSYMEAYAKFETNKAYFAKIKEVRFERDNHNIISDKDVYKFIPGDNQNYDYSNFKSSTDKWYVS